MSVSGNNVHCFTLNLHIYSLPLRPTPPPPPTRRDTQRPTSHTGHLVLGWIVLWIISYKMILLLERIVGNKMILSQFHLVLRRIVARIVLRRVFYKLTLQQNEFKCQIILWLLQKNIMTDNVPKPRYRKQCYLLNSFKIISYETRPISGLCVVGQNDH